MGVQGILDELGIHEGSPVLSVAGYFARPKVWREFTRDWRRILLPKKIGVFHSSDCQALRGEFENWTREERDELVSRLLPIIPKHSLVGFAAVIVLRDFYAAVKGKEHLVPLIGTPYGACFQWLLRSAIEASAWAGIREPMAVFHENNDFHANAYAAFAWLKQYNNPHGVLTSLTFGDKKTYIPLQAADILAYEAGKRVVNSSGKDRRSFTAITPRGKRPVIKYYDKENMPKLIEKLERVNALRAV